MTILAIPAEALVFIGDGQKALFLRNAGDAIVPKLVVERVFHSDNPPTRDQGTDQPGRSFASAGTTARSSVEATDWHQLEKQHFARNVAQALEKHVRAGKVKALIVAAPPRTLAELRQALPRDVQDRILAEIDKDLTGHPVSEIERLLLDRT